MKPRTVGLQLLIWFFGLAANAAVAFAQGGAAVASLAQWDAYSRAMVFHGTCRLKVLESFDPCDGKVSYLLTNDNRAILSFDDEFTIGTFVLSGSPAKQGGASGYDMTVDAFRSTIDGKPIFDGPVMGDCQLSHSGAAVPIFHSIRCEVYTPEAFRRKAVSPTSPMLRIYLENITGYDDLKAPATAAKPVAGTGRRVALVVGNSGYVHGRLDNPKNDAALMAQALQSVGFEVTRLIDADQTTMKRAMLDFSRKARADAAATLFYYAGHAVTVDGENYLIPIDAEISDVSEVAVQAVNVNDFLGTLKVAASKVNIIVLDACRNNPFAAETRGLGGGLATMDAPGGTYIAFATAPGKVATEGDGANSPFTKALATAIVVPGLRIEDVFKEVRRVVIAETRQKQIPWDSTSITRDFYFVPGG